MMTSHKQHWFDKHCWLAGSATGESQGTGTANVLVLMCVRQPHSEWKL